MSEASKVSEQNASEVMDELMPAISRLAKSIADSAGKPIFDFMSPDQFRLVVAGDHADAAKVYWREILYRAHLVSVTALARHARWIDAALRHYDREPNFLGFACCLRGLLESAADIFYSLRAVPLTIANSITMVCQAVDGKLQTGAYFSEELEDLLIHFLYATRLQRKSEAPRALRAETAAEYVKCLIDEQDDSVRRMYEFLCSLTHPTTNSILWMVKRSRDLARIQFRGTDDREFVLQLASGHLEALKTITRIPVDISVCTLRVLNRIPLPEVHVSVSEAYEPGGWSQVVEILKKSGK